MLKVCVTTVYSYPGISLKHRKLEFRVGTLILVSTSYLNRGLTMTCDEFFYFSLIRIKVSLGEHKHSLQ